MGRPKGGKNREWSKEEKLKYVLMVVNGEKSSHDIEREFNIVSSLVRKWIRLYIDNGIDALENKRKPGNPLAKYSSRKELNELEKLEYENMLLRIENERLKKGYTEEDVAIAKLFNQNTK